MSVPYRHVTLEFADARLTAGNREAEWVVESLTGWFGGVGVKGTRTPRLGHGDFSAPNRRTGRSMTLGLVWQGAEGARDYVSRALSGLFPDGEEGTLTAAVGDLSLTAERVTLDGEVGIAEVGTQAVRAQIPLHAADPFLFTAWRQTTLRPIGTGVGLEYAPFSRDLGKGPVLTYGSAVDPTEWLWNDGNAEAFPRFTVTADAPGGFAIRMGEARVVYPWPTFADMPVTVDMAGALSVSGADQTHLLGERSWAGIAPSTVETPSLEFLQGGTGFCIASHRDAYL